MNNNSNIKYWLEEEETQLINEINNLTDINDILNNHNRKITGIIIRIEKILNDPIKSIKILNKDEVIEKYLTNTKNKYFTNYEELYTNILKFNSLEEISNNYNKLSLTKIKSILNNFMKRKDLELAKKLRIKCLLKLKDDIDFAEKIFSNKKNSYADDTNNTNNKNNDIDTNNINSVIILLLEEIKTMKTDIFDIKNRVKIIMDKVSVLDKNKNNIKIFDSKKNLELDNNLNDCLNLENDILNINEKISTSKKKDKKIKIIMIDNNNNDELKSKNNLSLNNFTDDNILEHNNDELDKEFKKILC
jgi:hypothetical protein